MMFFRQSKLKVSPPVLFLLYGMTAAVFFGCLSTSFKSVQYEPGMYEGSGRGYRGPITVRLLVSASGIEDIEIIGHREDDAIGGAAIDEIRELILEYGVPAEEIEPDAVSGATASCRGFLQAVENALQKARNESL